MLLPAKKKHKNGNKKHSGQTPTRHSVNTLCSRRKHAQCQLNACSDAQTFLYSVKKTSTFKPTLVHSRNLHERSPWKKTPPPTITLLDHFFLTFPFASILEVKEHSTVDQTSFQTTFTGLCSGGLKRAGSFHCCFHFPTYDYTYYILFTACLPSGHLSLLKSSAPWF